MNYFVYIMECEDGSLYTGITTDVARRLKEHLGDKKGARYTRAHAPKRITHTETFPSRSEALKREAAIKKLSRAEKLKLMREK